MPPAARLVLVGRVSGAFGVRGELRIVSYAERPLALLDYRDLRCGDGAPALTLTSARLARAGEVVARAKEVETREAAEALRGLQLYVPRGALPEPDDADEFYLTDLIGLEAVSPEGERLGAVKAVLNHGASDILEIDREGAAPRLVAFTRENVPHVRLAAGEVVVSLPAEVDQPEAPASDMRSAPERAPRGRSSKSSRSTGG